MDDCADSSILWGSTSTAERLRGPIGVLPSVTETGQTPALYSLNEVVETGRNGNRNDEECGRMGTSAAVS